MLIFLSVEDLMWTKKRKSRPCIMFYFTVSSMHSLLFPLLRPHQVLHRQVDDKLEERHHCECAQLHDGRHGLRCPCTEPVRPVAHNGPPLHSEEGLERAPQMGDPRVGGLQSIQAISRAQTRHDRKEQKKDVCTKQSPLKVHLLRMINIQIASF